MRTAIDLGRKALFLATGVALVVMGAAMLVLPGPGLLVLPAGLAILATEFPWARRVVAALRRVGERLADRLERFRAGRANRPAARAGSGARPGASRSVPAARA